MQQYSERYLKRNFSFTKLERKLKEIDKLALIKRSPSTTAILRELHQRKGKATKDELRLAVFPEFHACNCYTQLDLNTEFSSMMTRAKSRVIKYGIQLYFHKLDNCWYGIVLRKPQKNKKSPPRIVCDKFPENKPIHNS